MKKVFAFACAGALALLGTSCGGNKETKTTDSDSVAVESTEVVAETPDTDTIVTVVTEETTVEVTEEAPKAPATTTSTKTTKPNVKDQVKQGVDKVTEAEKKVEDEGRAAIKAVKKTAEQGVSDAEEKAKAWRDKHSNK
ncbi:MAG: hypothetical protein K2M87_00430 [Muribaculaceae bacterium]|nr:hypothetical protein [Muribaculaceae bacterium]